MHQARLSRTSPGLQSKRERWSAAQRCSTAELHMHLHFTHAATRPSIWYLQYSSPGHTLSKLLQTTRAVQAPYAGIMGARRLSFVQASCLEDAEPRCGTPGRWASTVSNGPFAHTLAPAVLPTHRAAVSALAHLISCPAHALRTALFTQSVTDPELPEGARSATNQIANGCELMHFPADGTAHRPTCACMLARTGTR